MKRSILFLIALVLAIPCFAGDGANGWWWGKASDSMTDQVQFTFLKGSTTGTDPALLLIYVPSRDQWVWGFFSELPWEKDEINYRFDKEPAHMNEYFVMEGKRAYRTMDDLKKFLSYSVLLLHLTQGEEYRYSMAGLEKTILMAGIALKP